MTQEEIRAIAEQFCLEGTWQEARELTSGNINATYRLTYALPGGGTRRYVLQRINTATFRDPEGLMRNVQLVTGHIAAAMDRLGIDKDRRILTFVPARNGTLLYRDAQGGVWRVCLFIENATAYECLEDPRLFYEVGRGFGEFQRFLADFPAGELTETIPDFHNTQKRYRDFLTAVEEDRAGRAAAVAQEIAFLREREKPMGQIVDLLHDGTLPLRVTHNDAKLSNVMVDNATGKAICVIDLDTVMPGASLYDYGDAIRSGACTAAEDEPDLDKVSLDLSLFRRFTDGFVSETAGTLTPEELHRLPLGAAVIVCEQAMRFLTDYLNGDTYYKTLYPGHNLVRTHAQMKLLTEIEAHYDEMTAYTAALADRSR